MNRRMRVLSATLLMACFGSLAHAADMSTHLLGDSYPLWYEYRAAVNDSGEVAWSETVGGFSQARLYRVANQSSVNLHALVQGGIGPSAKRSMALEINANGDVAGFWSQTGLDTHRQAVLWDKGAGAYTVRNLHSAVTTDYTLSAAYAVSERQAGQRLVVGYQRKRMEPGSYSEPRLWVVAANGSVSASAMPLGTDHAYAIPYGLSEVDKNGDRWACGTAGLAPPAGASSPVATFAEAACWKITSSGATYTAGTLTPVKGARVGTETAIATSSVTRVRSVNLGPLRGVQTLAVGFIVYTNGAMTGFVKNLTTDAELDTNFEITAGADSILSDVTRLVYARNTTTSIDHAYGPLVVGVSATSALGYSEAPPVTTPVAALRPAEQARVSANGVAPEDVAACDLRPLVTPAGPNVEAQLVSSISRDARYRVAYGDGKLMVLTDKSFDPTIFRVNVRDSIRYETPTRSVAVRHYWMTWDGKAASNLAYRWSQSAGCAPVANGQVCSDFHTGLSSSVGTMLRSGASRTDEARPSSTYAYVQASAVVGSNCVVSPVYLAEEVEVVNPNTNYDTSEQWAACGTQAAVSHAGIGGARVDLKSDALHCGQCGRSAEDGKFCTRDTCASGAVSNVHDPALGCFITVNGTKTCFDYGDYQPYKDQESPRLLENYCRQCKVGNATGWTALYGGAGSDPCCNADGTPRDSRWASGRRPTTFPNLVYTNHNTFNAATNEWVTRLPSITDGYAWSMSGLSGKNDSPECTRSGSGGNTSCSVKSSYAGTCSVQRNSDNDRRCAFQGCNSSTTGNERGPRKLKSYLRSPAGSEDWYVFNMTDSTSYRNNPRVRVVPDNSSHNLTACMYAYCVDPRSNRDFLTGNQRPDYKRRVGTDRQTLTGVPTAQMPISATNPLRPDRVLFGACDSGTTSSGAARDLYIDMEMQNADYGNDCWEIDFYVQVRRTDESQAATGMCWGYSMWWGNDRREHREDANNGHYEDSLNANICDSVNIPLETAPLN